MKHVSKLLVACSLSFSSIAIAQQTTPNAWTNESNNYTTGRVGIGSTADTAFLFTINQKTTGRFGAHKFMQLINANGFKLLDITGTTYSTNGVLNLVLYKYDKTEALKLSNINASSFFNGIEVGTTKSKANIHINGGLSINDATQHNDFNIKSIHENCMKIDDTQADKGTTLLINHNSKTKRIIAVQADSTKPTFQLFSDGTLVAKNVFAENIKADKAALSKKWPDYVFHKSYELRSIPEVEQYIAKNGHLPDVPSQTEVTANGVDLGEMNAVLLKKVEELTLYMIQLQKQNDQLQQSINQLQKR